MNLVSYEDGSEWDVIDLGRWHAIFIQSMYRSIICENGRCWVPRATDFEEHISFFKRK